MTEPSADLDLLPDLPGMVHGIVEVRRDRHYPSWDGRHWLYVLQCDDCGSRVSVRGQRGLMLTSYRFHTGHDSDDRKRRCADCRRILAQTCEQCRAPAPLP